MQQDYDVVEERFGSRDKFEQTAKKIAERMQALADDPENDGDPIHLQDTRVFNNLIQTLVREFGILTWRETLSVAQWHIIQDEVRMHIPFEP